MKKNQLPDVFKTILNESVVLARGCSAKEFNEFALKVWNNMDEFFSHASVFVTSWTSFKTLVAKVQKEYTLAMMFSNGYIDIDNGVSKSSINIFIENNIVTMFNIAITVMLGNDRSKKNNELIRLLKLYHFNTSILQKVKPESFILVIKRASGKNSDNINRYHKKMSSITNRNTSFGTKTLKEIEKTEKSLHFLRKLMVKELTEMLTETPKA